MRRSASTGFTSATDDVVSRPMEGVVPSVGLPQLNTPATPHSLNVIAHRTRGRERSSFRYRARKQVT